MATVDSWTDLGFANLQSVLDEQGTKIAVYQEEGGAARQALSSKTKAFRKLSDDEKLGEIRGLLKAYQSGIDALTTRCQFAESCFMNVYRTLALVPDPSPLLQQQQQELERLRGGSGGESGPEESRLARDLERQTQRVAQLESRLKRQAAAPSEPAAQALEARVDELEAAAAAAESRLAQSQTQVRELQAQAAQQQQDLRKSLAELAVKQDYDDLRREVTELREAAADAGTPTPASVHGAAADGSEAAGLRLANQTLETAAKRLTAQNEQLSADLGASRQLVAKLEDDLSSLNQSDTFSTISGWTAVPRSGQRDVPVSAAIITQQRDRYKARAHDLEERLHGSEVALGQARRDLDAIRKDNRALYERVRSMQTAVPTAAPLPKRLYEPTTEMNMKDLGIDRTAMGMSRVNAAVFRVFGRAVADERFRQGICVYALLIHAALLWSLGHSGCAPSAALPDAGAGAGAGSGAGAGQS